MSRPIKIGFVPMTDCATLLVADALGLFERHGLQVRLCREAGWATVREKMLNCELNAAHAPASMVFEMTCGLGVVPVPSQTGLVMALNGNAITISNELYEMGVRDAKSLKSVVERYRGKRKFTFAGVLNFSSQHYLMRKWLRSGGIDPDNDVNIAIVPPPLVSSSLKKGYLDGFCVAEPWSSLSLLKQEGWCTTLTADFDPLHVEKVFMVRTDFDVERHEEHVLLVAALIEAAMFCDEPSNRGEVAAILSREPYLDIPLEVLKPALVGPFYRGHGVETAADNAIIFHRNDAGRPTPEKAQWVIDEIIAHDLGPKKTMSDSAMISQLYREDIFEEALRHFGVSDEKVLKPSKKGGQLTRS